MGGMVLGPTFTVDPCYKVIVIIYKYVLAE